MKDEALKLALEALESVLANHNGAPVMPWIEARDAIKQALALDKMADNARELGLDYEPHKGLSEHIAQATNGRVYVDPVTGDVGIGTPAAPTVQEPLGYLEIDDIESQREYPHNCRNVNLWHEGGEGMAAIYTTPPAQRQWVGLTDEDKAICIQATVQRGSADELIAAIEAKLKEKNA